MSTIRYTNGDAVVTLSGDMEAWVRQAVESATGGLVSTLEAAAEEVAAQARSEWYDPPTGVQRQTGQSGDIQVYTTVSDSEVRVSILSTDTRTYRGKPLPLLIRRAGVLALDKKMVSRSEWWEWKRSGKPVGPMGKGESDWTILVHAGERASDGKYLMTELIRKPARIKIKGLIPELSAALVSRIKQGS